MKLVLQVRLNEDNYNLLLVIQGFDLFQASGDNYTRQDKALNVIPFSYNACQKSWNANTVSALVSFISSLEKF